MRSTAPGYIECFDSSPNPQKVFISLLDVLGFKHRVQTTPLLTLLHDYNNLIATGLDSRNIHVISPDGISRWTVGWWVFSDTVLIWSNDDWESFQTLLTSTAHLISAGLRLHIPLRCGIAFGECVLNREDRIFIGKAIVDAYETEQAQEWLGGALHSSVFAHPTLGPQIDNCNDVIKYPVPVKRGISPLNYAVHWGPYSTGAISALKTLSLSQPCSVRRKYARAIKYVHQTCAGFHAVE